MKSYIDFFDTVFESNKGVPNIYSNILFKQDNTPFYSSSSKEDKELHNSYYIKFFPNYLKPILKHNDNYRLIKISHVKGYSALLDDFSDVDSYLKHQFKSNAKTIRRYLKRLENCFNIRYKLYHGEIDKEQYFFIMDTLQNMLHKRFDERNDKDYNQKHWGETLKNTYTLIKEKRASLFVIYAENQPIEISINYHKNNILYSSISSYDINYSKFGLGHVEIYKQIEWCLENDYKLFEMGRGDLDYKRRWSNNIYDFEYHLIYHKKSKKAMLFSTLTGYIIRQKLYLKKIHSSIKKIIFKKKNRNTTVLKIQETSIIENIKPYINYRKIQLSDDVNSFLRQPLYDFLYTEMDHISNVEIFKIEKKVYLIKGSKKNIKIKLA